MYRYSVESQEAHQLRLKQNEANHALFPNRMNDLANCKVRWAQWSFPETDP